MNDELDEKLLELYKLAQRDVLNYLLDNCEEELRTSSFDPIEFIIRNIQMTAYRAHKFLTNCHCLREFRDYMENNNNIYNNIWLSFPDFTTAFVADLFESIFPNFNADTFPVDQERYASSPLFSNSIVDTLNSRAYRETLTIIRKFHNH